MADQSEQIAGFGRVESSEAAGPTSGRPRRIKIILLVAALVVLLAGTLWFIRYQTVGKYFQETNDAYIQADAVTVAPKISGYIERVFVHDNQAVRVGQPLLQIDPRDYRALAAQYEAQIDVSRANAEGVRAQVREQNAAVDKASADFAAALSDAGFARAEVARYEPLAASGAESGERLSQLRNEARLADTRVASARATLEGARRRIGTYQAQVTQALSQGLASRAQLDAARVNLGATVVRASIDGRIGNKTAQAGQFVQAGTRMMSVVPVQSLYIEANFKETQLGLMRVGQPVSLEVDALSGIELHGHVQSIAPGTGAEFSLLPPQNATGNFTKIVQRVPVRIAVDAGPQTRKLLVPGMSVTVTVDTRSAKGERERIRQEQEARR